MKPQAVVQLCVFLIITLANFDLTFGKIKDQINPIDTVNGDLFRLHNLQRRFLDLVGNSTSGVHDFQDMINIFHTDAGDELGRLFIEGVLLGATQDDSLGILTNFWGELQHRLPGHLVRKIHGYGNFFDGLDASTFALTVEKLFEKDFLGNSLAGLPLGQLVDMVQPVASRYGIDIKSVINSLMGKGDNNVKDFIVNAIQSMDVPSLVRQMFNSTSKSSVEVHNKSGTDSADLKVKSRSVKKDSNPLQLFKPLIANLLKENGINLDVDAVIEVVSPLLNAEMLSQLVPMLTSMLGGKSGGAASMLPLLAGLMGGGGGQKNAGAMLGGLGALMGGMGGEKGKMDPLALLNMASMFMGNGNNKRANTLDSDRNKPNKVKRENNLDMGSLLNVASAFMGNGNTKKTGKNNLDMGSLLNVASAFMGNGNEKKAGKNNLDMGSILNVASAFMGNGNDKKAGKNNLDMGSLLNVASAFMDNGNNKKPKVAERIEKKNANIPDSNSRTQNSKPIPPQKDTQVKKKNLIDIFEPVILSMQTDKQCNKKISEAIRFGKAVLSKKMIGISDLGKMLPSLVSSVIDADTLSTRGLDLPTMMGAMQQAFKNADWREFLNSIENEDFRQNLFRTVTPHISELVILLSSDDVQLNLYNAIVPKIDGFFSSYGLAGMTLENFPGRIGPMLGMFSRGWNLPFNPTTLLVPLKEYIIGLRSWAISSLEDVKAMEKNQVSFAVMKALEDDLSESLISVLYITRNSKPQCLPQLLCELNQQNDDDTFKSAVTRAVSVLLGGSPVLETSEAKLLLEIVQAANSSPGKPCKVRFPGKCNIVVEKDSSKMETHYESIHQPHEDL